MSFFFSQTILRILGQTLWVVFSHNRRIAGSEEPSVWGRILPIISSLSNKLFFSRNVLSKPIRIGIHIFELILISISCLSSFHEIRLPFKVPADIPEQLVGADTVTHPDPIGRTVWLFVSCTSHTRMVSSSLPDTMCVPSAVYSSEKMALVCPIKVLMRFPD